MLDLFLKGLGLLFAFATASGAFAAEGNPPGTLRLAVSPASFDTSLNAGTVGYDTLVVKNLGPADPLGYTVRDTVTWLSEFPDSGSLRAGDSVLVTVTFDARSLSQGRHPGLIIVVDPHHGPINVPVTLNVLEPRGVESNLTLHERPLDFRILGVYPNPVSARTSIRFELPREARIRLSIYNALGCEVAALVNATLPRGVHVLAWDGTAASGARLPKGTYFYQLATPNASRTGRLLILR